GAWGAGAPAMAAKPWPAPPDACRGGVLAFVRGRRTRLAMACRSLRCTLSGGLAAPQARLPERGQRAAKAGQSGVAIGPPAAIVRADFGPKFFSLRQKSDRFRALRGTPCS